MVVVETENENALVETLIAASNWDMDTCKMKDENGFRYAIQNFSQIENLNKITQIINE